MEKQIDEVGESEQYSGTERSFHMKKELLRQSGIDKLYTQCFHSSGRLGRKERLTDVLQQTVGDETIVLWSQDDAEQLFLETEGCDCTYHNSNNHLYQTVAQFIEMIPKSHGFMC